MMFATLCWFLACNESNRIESNRLVCGTESNRIESFSLLPNCPSLIPTVRCCFCLLLSSKTSQLSDDVVSFKHIRR